MFGKILCRVQGIANSSDGQFGVVIGLCCLLGVFFSALIALPWGGFISASCQWDCSWYMSVVTDGYTTLPLLDDASRRTQANWAFFPLYPLLVSGLKSVSFLSAKTSGLLVNLLLWPVLIFLSYRDLVLRRMPVDRLLFALFFVCYPFNIWYMAQYSEGIYGVLLVGTVVALRSHKVVWAALICALMALARPTGFVMAIVMAAWWLLHSWPKERLAQKERVTDSLLLVSAAGAGLSLYVLYLFHIMGDGFAFAHVQIAWNRHFGFFLKHVADAFTNKHQVKYGIFAVLGFIVIWRMCKQQWSLNALVVGVTALLASSTGVESIERFIFSNPFTIQFLAYATVSRSRRFMGCVFVGMVLLHVVTTILWYNQRRWVM
ncbi:membrane protein [Acetobacter cibinongensis]|uniref:Membrane protein n=1 Tax=Acetobacter cibinongensis TaxID=146475 RepID=A0A0D6N7B2_9PROT|nr:hypothetical protein [Acetobacter cibinongensis]GAN61381.1 hypothetical protein Abci_018_251 [Acetobacter cibinongensis]GEL57725.1 membrane protein [Acetobacter cibinongensis]